MCKASFVAVAVAALAAAVCSGASGSQAASDAGAKPDGAQADAPASGENSGPPVQTAGTSSRGADQACTPQNTMGLWSLIHIESAEPGVREFYQTAPYEYMRIGPTGAYAYFASPAAAQGLNDIRNRIDRTDAADGVNDVVDLRQPGLFVVLRDGQPFQAFTCFIAGTARARHQPGDMVWTEYQGMADLYRVQRRLQ